MLREQAEDELNSNLPISILPHSDLSPRQLLFIEHYLASHKISTAAEATGISVHTAYNYLADPVVLAEIRARAYVDLSSQRKHVADALLKGATNPKSKSQAAMQRIFWTLLGDLTEKKEISGPGGGPIQVESREIFDSLSPEEKRKIIEILERNTSTAASREKVISPEYRRLNGHNTHNLNPLRAVPMPFQPTNTNTNT